MSYSTKILSQTVTQLCKAKNITYIVISPGSRNAPLTIGFTSDTFFKCFSIIDERCAAFFALGIAQQHKKPVVLVCTSGSALLNYYPAIAEAFYSNVPLVILSADRPEHLLNIGDGQTINQKNVFANHIAYSVNCREGETHNSSNEIKINSALNTAIQENLPVHINIPFSEPLYETVTTALVKPKNINVTKEELWNENLESYHKKWNVAGRKLILVGVLPPDSIEKKWIDVLANDPSVLVLTETTSNLHHKQFIHSIDALIASLNTEEFKQLQPEILVTFGGMIISKKIKAFLRSFPPQQHWHIDKHKAYDTYFCLSKHFKTEINIFLNNFLPKTTSDTKSNFQKKWLSVFNSKKQKQLNFEKEVPYSDFYVFSELIKQLPKGSQLQIANSASIRYAQLFKIDSSITVFCNRGTSGIDGSTSTAIGAAVASGLPTVFITGDLSFFYDSNALWNKHIPINFKIILINNSGGGIFRIIAKNKTDKHFSEFFETKHSLNASHLCAMHDITYHVANDKISLQKKLQVFFNRQEKPALLEVKTPSKINDVILKDFFDTIGG